MNSKYVVKKEDWDALSVDERLWLIFNTREEDQKRFRRLEFGMLVMIILYSANIGYEKIIPVLAKMIGI